MLSRDLFHKDVVEHKIVLEDGSDLANRIQLHDEVGDSLRELVERCQDFLRQRDAGSGPLKCPKGRHEGLEFVVESHASEERANGTRPAP